MESNHLNEIKDYKNKYLLEDGDYSLNVILNKSKFTTNYNKFPRNLRHNDQPIKDKMNYYFLITLIIISILALTIINNSRIKTAVLLPCFLSLFIYFLSFFGIDIRKHYYRRNYLRLYKR